MMSLELTMCASARRISWLDVLLAQLSAPRGDTGSICAALQRSDSLLSNPFRVQQCKAGDSPLRLQPLGDCEFRILAGAYQ